MLSSFRVRIYSSRAIAAVFDGMAGQEDAHRLRLIDMHRNRFGGVITLIRREDVSGFSPVARSGWSKTLILSAAFARPQAGRRTTLPAGGRFCDLANHEKLCVFGNHGT